LVQIAASRDGSSVTRAYPARVTYEELLELARRYEGRTLETVTGKRFKVGIYLDCPFFTPESTGRGQSDGRAAAERFAARYTEIGSLRPGDYSGVTRNASYYVALLRQAQHTS
jgi:hypothetical protein